MKSLNSMRQSVNNLINIPPVEFKSNIVTDYQLVRDNGEIVVVEIGKRDLDKEIQEMSSKAGLTYILKAAAMKYGSVENAIYHIQEEAHYMDISEIPDNLSEQVDYVLKSQQNMAKLAKDYGLTVEEFNKLTNTELVALIKKKYEPEKVEENK